MITAMKAGTGVIYYNATITSFCLVALGNDFHLVYNVRLEAMVMPGCQLIIENNKQVFRTNSKPMMWSKNLTAN
jgi:hypothetical protein